MMTRARSLTRIRTVAGIVGIIGIIAALIGLLTNQSAFFHAYLVGFACVALISLGCLFLLLINQITGGHWSIPVRESLEGGAQLIVVTALLFIPIVFGLSRLYPWAQPNTVSADPLLQHQSPFLNPTFFVIRAVIYFAVWIFLAWRMTRPGTPKRTTAIIGLVLYFPSATLAAIDWFMSLEPHWYSTIYGVLFLASQALTAYAFVIVLLLLTPTPAPEASERQTRQDLGNVLLTILITVTYLQFMQFLVIWAGDLPDEITWYVERTADGWSLVALALIVLNIAVPFVLLLSRGIKSRVRSLALVALLILIAQFVYVYWLIVPAFGAAVDGLTLILPIGMCGLWIAAFAYRLRGAAHEA
ncbi:MAG TPA: hypothetical protein VHD90_13735 [Phototrophicaceae bacterium]|nr:hypothetical protein [Phototrophicaceae bacterium]